MFEMSYRRARTAYFLLLTSYCLLLLAACAQDEVEVVLQRVPGGDAERGERVIMGYGCPACHTIPGIITAEAQVGPPLTDWADRTMIAGSLPNTSENLIRWLMNPQEVEPGTAMPDMGVTELDARDMAAYLYTLGGESEQEIAEGIARQPVPFSHQYHAGGLGIDCRYCHSSVERSPFAGMPPTETCMTCHSQIWTRIPLLEPVRASWEHEDPIPWVRVYNLSEFTYFNHASHVNSGVGCDVCHGQVDEMAVIEQVVPMTMEWCLDCHRQPEQYLRPRDEVFNLDWEPPANQVEMGRELIEAYEIPVEILTDCSLCHH